MKEIQDKVAVVTGAASGIGRALAERFAAEGMKVVLADFNPEALAAAESEMRASGAEVLAVCTDVSRAAEVEELARRALEAFGAVHIVCNNAGVATPPAPSWEKTIEDYEWVLGANLWGVIHGIRAFLPILLRQDQEGHVVNTASAAGLICTPWGADYLASKHAVVSLSECLHLELQALEAKVRVSVLCPGFVRTAILDAVDRRSGGRRLRPEAAALDAEYRRLIKEATPPAEIAEQVLVAVRAERFYVLPHPEVKPFIEARAASIVDGRDPPQLGE